MRSRILAWAARRCPNSLAGWVGQTLDWTFSVTFPAPDAQFRTQTQSGGIARHWFLPSGMGVIAPHGPSTPGSTPGGLVVSTFDDLRLGSIGVPELPDGIHDAVSLSGFALGASFERPAGCGTSAICPGTIATGLEDVVEILGSPSMLEMAASPSEDALATDLTQIRPIARYVNESAAGSIAGAAGSSGGLDAFDVGTGAQTALLVTAAPEPGAWSMLPAGLGVLGLAIGRRPVQRRKPSSR